MVLLTSFLPLRRMTIIFRKIIYSSILNIIAFVILYEYTPLLSDVDIINIIIYYLINYMNTMLIDLKFNVVAVIRDTRFAPLIEVYSYVTSC